MREEHNDESDDSEEPEIFYENLKRKLSDEVVIKKIYNAKREIEHTLGCQIVLSVANVEEEYAEDIFNSLNNIGIDKKSNSMKLGFLIDYLSSENKDLNVYIDPLHLKPGVNPLTNLVLVAMDDYIILVPKNEI
jgi:hypothetical protein